MSCEAYLFLIAIAIKNKYNEVKSFIIFVPKGFS